MCGSWNVSIRLWALASPSLRQGITCHRRGFAIRRHPSSATAVDLRPWRGTVSTKPPRGHAAGRSRRGAGGYRLTNPRGVRPPRPLRNGIARGWPKRPSSHGPRFRRQSRTSGPIPRWPTQSAEKSRMGRPLREHPEHPKLRAEATPSQSAIRSRQALRPCSARSG